MLELKQKNVRNSIGKKNLFFMFVNCSVDIIDPRTKFNFDEIFFKKIIVMNINYVMSDFSPIAMNK
jgi:hypothetical protein